MNSLAQLYSLAQQNQVDIPTLQANAPGKWPWVAWGEKREADKIYRGVGEALVKALDEQTRAAKQGTVVNASMDAYGAYDDAQGVQERTSITFGMLRQMAHDCEPAAAIIETWVRYVQAFCRRPDTRRGYVKRPGIKLRMRIPSQKATEEDKVEMERLTEFLLNTGFCDPPEEERPVGWQRGLKAFASAVIRDTLTLDGVAVRRWGSAKTDGRGNPVVPIVSFSYEDAARIRRVRPEFLHLKNGVPKYRNWRGERTNNQGMPIKFVKMSGTGTGGSVVEEYTRAELAYLIRNVRSEEEANGYGYSELERCINCVTIWLNARTYNASRFERDTLPRGILTILGQLNETQFQSFRLKWKQLMEGIKARWDNPVFKGQAQAGAGVTWTPIDMSSRDMEYHQFLFSVALWMHSIFGIHPEETGYEALSPFKPPLSEASPEVKLENSSDKGFEPLLRWFEDILNHEILWVLDPSKRYCVEFVGVGQGDEAADVELRGQYLNFGLTTPRRQLAELDETVPEALEDDPAMDMLGTWAANRTLLMQMEQAQQGMQQQQMTMQQQQEAHTQQMGMNKMQQFQQMNGQGEDQPGGMPGQPGRMPPGQDGPPPADRPDRPMGSALRKALFDPYDFFPERDYPRRKRARRSRTVRVSGSLDKALREFQREVRR